MVRGAAVVVAFAVPGSLDQPTGGYAYDRRVIAGLRQRGCEVEVIDLGDGFPRPTEELCRAAAMQLKSVPQGRPIVIDGLALGVLPQAAQALSASNSVVALVHHPLALEAGLSKDTAAALRASERTALAAARHVITTSKATARLLVVDYAVAASAITVAVPGTEMVALSGPRQAKGPLNLLAVGAVVQRKGYDVLIEALARLTDLDWQLEIVGDCTRDRDVAGALATRLVVLRLTPRVRLAGAVAADELDRRYRAADLFVLASRYEGYGMAFADAISHGLPVVGTKAGAIPETVPEGAGVLVPPDDVVALAAALRSMISDRERRSVCAAAARRAAAQLPRWDATVQAFLDVLRVVM
jgi:glycosyltransferase involved in cell wall biosynthesis